MFVLAQMRPHQHWQTLTISHQAVLRAAVPWELVLLRVQVTEGRAPSQCEWRKQHFL